MPAGKQGLEFKPQYCPSEKHLKAVIDFKIMSFKCIINVSSVQ
jgi:hypothetical protein